MIKRYLAGIALLTVITMSGCSAKVQETTADAGTTPAASAPAAEAAADSGAASDVIEIEFWHALENQYEETLNRVVGDFNSTHDSIVVKPMYIGNYSALNEAIVSANAANTNLPGVAMANIPYVTGYGAGGLCEDLGPYIQRDGFEIDDFGEGLIQAAKYEDVQVALPFLVSTEVVYYNRDLMKELGLEMPKTWDEMPQFLEKASDVGADGKTNRYGMVIPGWITWYYEPFFVNNGVQMVTPEGRTDLASDNSIKLVSQLKDWCQKGYTYLATGEDAASVMRQNFIDGDGMAARRQDKGAGIRRKCLIPPGQERSEGKGRLLGIPLLLNEQGGQYDLGFRVRISAHQKIGTGDRGRQGLLGEEAGVPDYFRQSGCHHTRNSALRLEPGIHHVEELDGRNHSGGSGRRIRSN